MDEKFEGIVPDLKDEKIKHLENKVRVLGAQLDAQTEETRKATAALLDARQTLAMLVEQDFKAGNFISQNGKEVPYRVPVHIFVTEG